VERVRGDPALSTTRALEDVLYAIKAIPGVARTTSTVVLSTEFEERPLRWPGAN